MSGLRFLRLKIFVSRCQRCFSSRVQYKTCKDGSVLGVTVTRAAMLTHCQALTQSCAYTEGNTHTHTHAHVRFNGPDDCLSRPAAETIVNVLDFKKDVGLWHAVQTVRCTSNIHNQEGEVVAALRWSLLPRVRA